MRLLPLLLGAAAADSNLWLKGEESVIRFGERALLSARCLCDEPNVTCNATAPPTPAVAPEATVLFYTPQVVGQSQLGSENVRAFVQGIALSCVGKQVTEPCVAGAEFPEFPPTFYCSWNMSHTEGVVAHPGEVFRTGPVQANLSLGAVHVAASGGSTIQQTLEAGLEKVKGATIDCPLPPADWVGNATVNGSATWLELSVAHYVPTSASSTFDADAQPLAYKGSYGGDMVHVEEAAQETACCVTCKDLKAQGDDVSGKKTLLSNTGGCDGLCAMNSPLFVTYEAYCDMSTLNGGWTLAVRVNGQSSTLNRKNTAQWQNAEPLGDILVLDGDNALGEAYKYTPFTDVMVASTSDTSKHVAWQHPTTYANMKAVVNACVRINDGVKLNGDVVDLHYSGDTADHRACTDMHDGDAYGFFGYDHNTQQGDSEDNGAYAYTAGCDFSGGFGSIAGVVAVSRFSAKNGIGVGVNSDGHKGTRQDGCVSDFGVGGGYRAMDSTAKNKAISSHKWGSGITPGNDYNVHGVFVR